MKKGKKNGIFCPNISVSCFFYDLVMTGCEKHGFTGMITKLNELIKKLKGFSNFKVNYDI